MRLKIRSITTEQITWRIELYEPSPTLADLQLALAKHLNISNPDDIVLSLNKKVRSLSRPHTHMHPQFSRILFHCRTLCQPPQPPHTPSPPLASATATSFGSSPLYPTFHFQPTTTTYFIPFQATSSVSSPPTPTSFPPHPTPPSPPSALPLSTPPC